MAKKTKKVKKQTHITPEELTEMKTLVNQSNSGHLDLGRLSMQKHRILHALAAVQDKITLFQQKLEEKSLENVETGVGPASIVRQIFLFLKIVYPPKS